MKTIKQIQTAVKNANRLQIGVERAQSFVGIQRAAKQSRSIFAHAIECDAHAAVVACKMHSASLDQRSRSIIGGCAAESNFLFRA